MIHLIKLWLEKLTCKHNWFAYHETKIFVNDDDKRPKAIRHTMICNHCGKIKRIIL